MAADEERPAPFKLERFFSKYEFSAPHLMCCSDCEPLLMREVLALADAEDRERWDSLRLAYTETTGLPELRQAVSDVVYGGAISPTQLLVCAPEEGVYLTMRALLKKGDRVVSTYPSYQSLYELALAAGCAVDHWQPSWDAAAGRYAFDAADLERLVAPAGGGGPPPKLVVVNFPHNPTGASLRAGGQARVVAACRAAGSYLFSDEMYMRSEPEESARLPPAAALYERAVSLCGLSKSWALPGLRIGWLASRDAALLSRAAALKDYTTICAPGPSEVLALIAVKATEELTGRARRIIAENTALADAFFARWPAVFEVRLEALKRPGTGEPLFAGIDDFCQRLVGGAGVLLLPASVYDHEPSVERGHFRLGLGRKSFAGALKHLEAWLTDTLREAGIAPVASSG